MPPIDHKILWMPRGWLKRRRAKAAKPPAEPEPEPEPDGGS